MSNKAAIWVLSITGAAVVGAAAAVFTVKPAPKKNNPTPVEPVSTAPTKPASKTEQPKTGEPKIEPQRSDTFPGQFFNSPEESPIGTVEAVSLALPDGVESIGSVARGLDGHIWFTATVRKGRNSSAKLFDFDPATGKCTERGDAGTQSAKASGRDTAVFRSKLVVTAKGIHFATGDSEETSTSGPKGGSMIWRVSGPDAKWERLFSINDGATGLAVHDSKIAVTARPENVIVTGDDKGGKTVSHRIKDKDAGTGATEPFYDAKGRLYVSRVEEKLSGKQIAEILEYDPEMKEVKKHELDPGSSQIRIIGEQPLADYSFALVGEDGVIRRLTPGEKCAEVKTLGKAGEGKLFAISTSDGKSHLFGLAQTKSGFEWLVWELKSGSMKSHPVKLDDASGDVTLSGIARDDQGNCYLGGQVKDDGKVRPLFVRIARK